MFCERLAEEGVAEDTCVCKKEEYCCMCEYGERSRSGNQWNIMNTAHCPKSHKIGNSICTTYVLHIQRSDFESEPP